MSKLPLTITNTYSAAGFISQTQCVTLLPVLPAPTFPWIDPGAALLPGQTLPTPAQQWFAGIPRDVNHLAKFMPAGPIAYLSPNGIDATAQVGSQSLTFATFKAAQAAVRTTPGSSVLCRRGGIYTITDTVKLNGISPTQLSIIGDYGDPTLPAPILNNGGSQVLSLDNANYLALVNLDVQPPVGPGANLLRIATNAKYVYASCCRFANNTNGGDGVDIEAMNAVSQIVFDNCVIAGNNNGANKCQGLYVGPGVVDVIWNGGMFYANGWIPNQLATQNQFSHSVYVHCPPTGGVPMIVTNAMSVLPSQCHWKIEAGANLQGCYCYGWCGGGIGRTGGLVHGNVFESQMSSLELRGCANIRVTKNEWINSPTSGACSVSVNDTDILNPALIANGVYALANNTAYAGYGKSGIAIGYGGATPPAGSTPNVTETNDDWTCTAPAPKGIAEYAAFLGLTTAQFWTACCNNFGGVFDPRFTANAALNWIG